MSSSEEEGEIGTECVTNYHFVNNRKEPISFTSLPLHMSVSEFPDGLNEQVFLRGTVDDGLHKIYKEVIAWKFDLSYVQPEILVATKKKKWITLHSPRKSFESIIRTILVTVYWLHFIKNNPEATGESIWNHLVKSFSSYEIKPSNNDLVDHFQLIRAATDTDRDLKKSECLHTILLEKPWEIKVPHEDDQNKYITNFINDEEENGDFGDDEGNEDIYDHVCAFCDNGGDLLSCEGRCMRSFHAKIEHGIESHCESLGLSDAQVEALPTFLCKNCQYKRHQCYVCGKLGSSDKSSIVEVYLCVSATCGHFYHPECVATKLHPEDEALAKILQNEIAAGDSFTCPAHKCFICKQGENKTSHDLQFAICRRCPKAYHRKCLPKRISECIPRRAWECLLPNRVLIYCMDHKIVPDLGTPERNQCIFPDMELKMKKMALLNNVVLEKRCMVSESFREETADVKIRKKVFNDNGSTKEVRKRLCVQGLASPRNPIISGQISNNRKSGFLKPYKSSTVDAIKLAPGKVESLKMLDRGSYLNSKQRHITSSNIESAKLATKKEIRSPPPVDTDLEMRMMSLIENCNASFDEAKFRSKFKVPSTHTYDPKRNLEKITQGKVDASVKAIRTALKKLENGGKVEDAKAVCEPQILKQIINWKSKFEVYLAPALHGMRYTSFGRHFTKVEKLQEIVDRLHWYVQSGDMVVDFCCGANDFSSLMKKKLDTMGKKCSFKNYDLLQPKNDFSFEKRDWMSVRSGELPVGSRLIMGLNPPFGVHAALANKFIDKALEFKPKLLILIVPEETKRLDYKRVPYDLIWEDARILSGKSFYLPGSLDVHDKQLEQWNNKSPPLYLWSHPDWTLMHKKIAEERGHFFNERERAPIQENDTKTIVSNYLMHENHDCYGDFSDLVHGVTDISSILDDVLEDNDEGVLIGGINSSNCHSDNDDKTEYMNEIQGDEKKQKDHAETSLQAHEKYLTGSNAMKFWSAVNSALNCNNFNSSAPNIVEMETVKSSSLVPNVVEMETGIVNGLAPNIVRMETIKSNGLVPNIVEMETGSINGLAPNIVGTETITYDSFCNLQPISGAKNLQFEIKNEGGTGNLFHIQDIQNMMNVEAPSTREELGGILPYPYPLVHSYSSVPYTPYTPHGYPASHVYDGAYAYPGSGVSQYNSCTRVYNPTMYRTTGYMESSRTDLRPTWVTSSNYVAPSVDYGQPRWVPANYVDPNASNLGPQSVRTSSNFTSRSLGPSSSATTFRPGP